MRVAVEEDGDEIFTPMPTHCVKRQCRKDGGGLIVERGGFMVCETCGSSYGKAERKGGG